MTTRERVPMKKVTNLPYVLLALVGVLVSATLPCPSFCEGITGQTFTSQSHSTIYSQIECLPPDYQKAIRHYVPIQKLTNIVSFLPRLSADDCFLTIIGARANTPDGRAFVFSQLDAEPSGKIRTLLLTALHPMARGATQGTFPLLSEGEMRILEAHAASDSDVNASLEALDALREFHRAEEALALRRREASISGVDSGVSLQKLQAERLRHYAWYGEVRLPLFAYDPPPLFSVVPAGNPVRVLAFGDFGTGSDGQIKAAAAMRAYSSKQAFNFGITLGDNFYGAADRSRVNSPYSLRWQSEWEELYGAIGIKFYPVFGNNDYYDPDSPAAELAYTQRSKTWDFPAPYYTFTAGSAQFFAIDNIRLSSDELDWLDRELGRSIARWKIVYGHYPIHAAGGDGEHAELIAKLLPILEKHQVQIYLSGHVHSMQDIQTDSPVHFYVSGAAGAGLAGDLGATYKKSVFKAATFGFTVLEIDDEHADVIFVDSDGKEIYRSHIAL
jgi:tartrate-resistant acid phosphatase type 5